MVSLLKGEEPAYGIGIGADSYFFWNVASSDGPSDDLLGNALGSQANLPQAFRDTTLGPRVGSPPHGNSAPG
jgi:hypothetical protein